MVQLWIAGRHHLTATLAVVMLMLVSCNRLAPILTPVGSIPSSVAADGEAIERAIERGAIRKGWRITDRKPGRIEASIVVRTHSAAVTIEYDSRSFRISYRDSENLMHKGDTIHRNYNRWVNNLRHEIENELVNAR